MFDPRTLDFDIVGLQVRNGGNIRVRRFAVVAFVVIVGCDLPVVICIDLPGMIELVILEIEIREPLLGVDPREVVFPGNLWFPFAV